MSSEIRIIKVFNIKRIKGKKLTITSQKVPDIVKLLLLVLGCFLIVVKL